MPHVHEVRWGIVGCGDVCEVKSGPALYKTPYSKLVAVMRRDATKAADFAHRHNVPKHYASAHDLIHDTDVNAVYVATPPGSHSEYALAAARAGKPCYVEKPMSRNYDECVRMVTAFRDARLPLFVAYYRRGMSRFLKAKDLIDSGALGTVTSVRYTMTQPAHRRQHGWRIDPAQSGGGLFLDLGSHTLDILDFLLGPLEDVAGAARSTDPTAPFENLVTMHFRTGAALGSAIWNFAADRHEDLIQIDGTDGHLALSTFGDEPVRLTRNGATEEFPFARPAHVHQGLVEQIVAELRGEGRCTSTGDSAARTAEVMDTVLEPFYGPRTGDFWSRPVKAR